MHGRFVTREVGPAIIGVLVLAEAVLWIVARPAGEPTARYLGQLLGAESILLLSIGLVLISTLPWVEEWFDGIDRAAIWHRRVAITGLVLLAPHVLLASNPDSTALGGPLGVIGAIGLAALALWAILPRWQSVAPAPLRGLVVAARDTRPGARSPPAPGGYARWRALHRTTGLFVAAGFVARRPRRDAFAEPPSCAGATSQSAPSGLGSTSTANCWRAFSCRCTTTRCDAVRRSPRPGRDRAAATRPASEFVPGQFAMVYLEAKDGWHRHPFTISSSPHERRPVTVKALGDYTSRIQELVEPGMPAVIGGPHGRFDHRAEPTARSGSPPASASRRSSAGCARSTAIWPQHVDFFYTAAGEAPFAQEIREIAAATDRCTRI